VIPTLSLLRTSFFAPEGYTAEQSAATRATLSFVGFRLLQLFAPFMPHITEMLYLALYEKTVTAAVGAPVLSLHQTVSTLLAQPVMTQSAIEPMAVILTVVNQVRKLKTEQRLSLKKELEQLTVLLPKSSSTMSNAPQQILCQEEQLIRGITKAKALAYHVYQEHEAAEAIPSLCQTPTGLHARVVLAPPKDTQTGVA